MELNDSSDPAELLAELRTLDGATIELVIKRQRDQAGRSFSAAAMDVLTQAATAWIGTRIINRWDRTSEPPTICRVEITVDVS